MTQPRSNKSMSLIVRTVCGWMKGFILLYGIYIILYGHLSPGGGFAGGVIAACAFVMIMLAEGKSAALTSLSRKSAATGESIGGLIFLLMALLGLVLVGTFFVNFLATPEPARFTLFSSGVIPVCNIGIGLKVACSIYLVVFVLSFVHLALTHNERGAES